MPPLSVPPSTALTITNPLVLYRALLATKQIDPDPAQHRLALHLKNLYFRLKDYSPQTEYASRLKAISQAVNESQQDESSELTLAAPGHPLRRNPLFAQLFKRKDFAKRDGLALTRVFTSHESAINLDSPRGLLLYGEVGTGKSMMVDLLADSLPTQKKKRWHFNTFMLEVLSRLEVVRKSRVGSGDTESEYSLFVLAKDLIEKSPVLFLDEFQLPDRAASKILSNLLTTFFQLGGVLIASSNRMPDELAKASGVEFAPPPRAGPLSNWLGLGPLGQGRRDPFAGNAEYAGFLEVLKARCEVWDMEGGRDWRRREVETIDDKTEGEEIPEDNLESSTGVENFTIGNMRLGDQQSLRGNALLPQNKISSEAEHQRTNIIAPKMYILFSSKAEAWEAVITSALLPYMSSSIHWEPSTLTVYGRNVKVPRQADGVVFWTFLELCGGYLGPADYITIASTYHTLILDEVPILTLSLKNEARRFITLLDALYEAKCKLVIRAEAGPDDLFFPEINQPAPISSSETSLNENDGEDAVYPETVAEIYQDQTSPFRPNISSYTEKPRAGYNPDQDSDFGPIPGEGNEIGRQVDFGMTSSFTGEDERFAYKRARSRLWEMCGARWHARSEPGWWKPLPPEIRRWERSSLATSAAKDTGVGSSSDVRLGLSIDLDKPAGLQGKELDAREQGIIKEGTVNPWRQKDYPPPKFGWTHAWGMVPWGKSAGAWGQGLDGLEQRKRDKDKTNGRK